MPPSGGDGELLSLGSPRSSFSVSRRNSVASDAQDAKRSAGATGEDTAALLAFYRRRCDDFQSERQLTLDRLAQIEVSKEETHRLKWELRARTDELQEVKEELRKANAALFEAKRARIDLEAENSELRRREQQDRDKIRHLLELTQPITEQVTFMRDCRPGARASFPVPAPRTYAYPSTMHIASERMREPSRRRCSSSSVASSSGEFRDTENLQQNFAAPGVGRQIKPNVRVVPGSKVLRTVYMPNEQTGELSATVESLRKQLEQHQQLAEAKTRHLVDQFAEEKAALLRHQQELEQKLELMEKQAEKTQRVLTQTTKDFLILRHQSQQQEREAHEELHSMSKKVEAFKQERDEVKLQVEREREELQEVAREEGNQTALTFRAQAISRERDLHILKEQYAAVQEACTARIQDLQARLTKLRARYRSLDRRRAMEMEGFSRDIASLKRHLQKLEVMHYGRRLTAQEREALRLDENYTLTSNELSDEIAALQHRIAELSADLAEA